MAHPDALEFVRLTGHTAVLGQIEADPRYLTLVRAQLARLREAPPPSPPAPARCPYLDSCPCHGERRCLEGTQGPARGVPRADGPATHYLVTPDACRACPANPAETPR